MPRILKKTRIKGTPPKVQLRTAEAEMGLYPAHQKIASDNRSGTFQSFWDDNETLLFLTSSNLQFPVGLEPSNPAFYRIDNTGSVVLNPELHTDIIFSGSITKGIGDNYAFITKQSQSLLPFNDVGNLAVEGKSTGNTFYAVGSKIADIGERFDQPLWSKTKIEIDLTPSVAHSFKIENYASSSLSFPMAYWDKDSRKWIGIGAGKEFDIYSGGSFNDARAMCEDQCIGFGSGLNQGGSGIDDYGIGAKISNFGFPYHVKYHGSESNTIAMSDYIQSPFLLEKIVLEWSGSLLHNNTRYGTTTTYTVSTFFILNQRKPFGYQDDAFQTFVCRNSANHTTAITTSALIPSSYNGGETKDTVRDLVTYAQVVGFTNNAVGSQIEFGSREYNIIFGDQLATDNFGTWGGQLVMSATIKNALSNEGLGELQFGNNDSGFATFMLLNKHSTRSGLFSPGGRDAVGTLERGKILSTTAQVQAGFGDEVVGYEVILDRYSKPNPYLLLPTDKLIFGWQLPMPNNVGIASGFPQYPGDGSELTFASAPAKITFYGSMIKESKEFHDTLNQPLTSISIHEVIGE